MSNNWTPELGQDYWFWNWYMSAWVLGWAIWDNSSIDKTVYINQPIYPTKQEALNNEPLYNPFKLASEMEAGGKK